MSEKDKLLLEIAKCKDFLDIIHDVEGADTTCSKIAKYQEKFPRNPNDYQVPEPWTGNPLESKYLVIGINPSIDDKEDFIHVKDLSKDDEVIDFFDNRLRSCKTLLEKAKTPYWANISKWINILIELNKKGNPFSAKRDFPNNIETNLKNVCFTDVIHCKSKKQAGCSKECFDKCFNNYLDRIIDLFIKNNKEDKIIFICFGKAQGHAYHLKQIIDLVDKKSIKYFVMPHPSDSNKDADIISYLKGNKKIKSDGNKIEIL